MSELREAAERLRKARTGHGVYNFDHDAGVDLGLLADAYLEARKVVVSGVCDLCRDYVNVHLSRKDFDRLFGEQNDV